MKYTDETTIEDIADYALNHWESFQQDVRGQKLKKWLMADMHQNDIAQLMEEQLHSDWAMLYPCLSAQRIFELLRRVECETANNFLKAFMARHKLEIEQERQKFSRLNNLVGRMQESKPVVGFLLAYEDHEPTGVYFLHEGINTFGSGSDKEDFNFQRITTSEGLLTLKHFEVKADYSGSLTLRVLAGSNFVLESDKNFHEGDVAFGDTIVLGGLRLTFLQNINR